MLSSITEKLVLALLISLMATELAPLIPLIPLIPLTPLLLVLRVFPLLAAPLDFCVLPPLAPSPDKAVDKAPCWLARMRSVSMAIFLRRAKKVRIRISGVFSSSSTPPPPSLRSAPLRSARSPLLLFSSHSVLQHEDAAVEVQPVEDVASNIAPPVARDTAWHFYHEPLDLQ